MTLPWHLTLKEDNALAIEPVEEVKSLRSAHTRFTDINLSANEERVLDNVAGKAIEIELTVEMGTAREVGLYVFRSPNVEMNGRKYLSITTDTAKRTIVCRLTRPIPRCVQTLSANRLSAHRSV